MKIKDIMNQPAVSCRHDDTLETAAALMWDHDIGSVPVVGEDRSLVGMITDRDICMAAYTKGTTLRDITVASAMAKEVFACHESDSLQDAEHLMSDKQIRRVPVIGDDNRPVGMLSLNDIARQANGSPRSNGVDREIARTLAAISQPREQRPERRAMAKPPV